MIIFILRENIVYNFIVTHHQKNVDAVEKNELQKLCQGLISGLVVKAVGLIPLSPRPSRLKNTLGACV